MLSPRAPFGNDHGMLPTFTVVDVLRRNAENRRRATWHGLLESAVIVVAVASILGFAGRFAWWCDLLSHFRLHYAVALVVGSAALVWRRRTRLAGPALLLGAVNAALLVPLFVGPRAGEPSPDAARLKVLLVNVRTENVHTDKVIDLIRQELPDIVVLQEVSDRWMASLTPLFETYQHRLSSPRDDNFGIAVLSKTPPAAWKIAQFGSAGVPSVLARFHFGSGDLVLIGTHPIPPVSREHTRLRNEQMDAIATFVAQCHAPVLLVGDLNATPWSSSYRQLRRATGLRDSLRGAGYQGSWPAWLPLLKIPIDHGLFSSGIRVVERHLGPGVGSDHLPVILSCVIDQGP